MKDPLAIPIIRELLKKGDVLLDPYRPGVLEKMGLGPDLLLKENPRLIIARLSGYGQSGAASKVAGHDINYISVAGALGVNYADNFLFISILTLQIFFLIYR